MFTNEIYDHFDVLTAVSFTAAALGRGDTAKRSVGRKSTMSLLSKAGNIISLFAKRPGSMAATNAAKPFADIDN